MAVWSKNVRGYDKQMTYKIYMYVHGFCMTNHKLHARWDERVTNHNLLEKHTRHKYTVIKLQVLHLQAGGIYSYNTTWKG
jgi:hypothetical protein